MRCWRITNVQNTDANANSSTSVKSQLELSFEYLMSRDSLQWISITTDQAMLISMCLQNMVDELIMKKQGKKFKKSTDRLKLNKNSGPFKPISRELSYGVDNHSFDNLHTFPFALDNVLLSQDPQIGNSSLFNNFLLTAQQESQTEEAERVTLDAFLMNGHKITVNIMSTDQTEDVLEAVAQQIEIPDDFVHYFGLYLVKKEDDGDNSIVRRFQEFESPYLSLKAANKDGVHRIVLRKGYWDSSYDDDLLENKVTMNLLYVQANNDIERQWILATKDQLNHLSNLKKKGSKREFLRLARTLKYYGYMQFKPCVTDYPQPNTRVIVCAGQKELNFRVNIDKTSQEPTRKPVIAAPEDQSAITKAMDSVKKMGKGGPKQETLTENDAFEGIGDEDL
uniref:Ras-associating domain-containing protein n=1 Tax=Biomphalaria glabrata TaxID=6526 RepID=A0A2C9M5Q8_BIOGL